ncbi:MAG: hypothetical protein JNL41_09595 [Phenylobacterium sp.]|uniref:hypothetical protein n=1 Tax=Phenylobacterium sp. TaxID=1871053 RepID=UPI001A5ECDBA|nr:hypothetical protein [Phenylobacterium sp.]MBL8554519.1 hypothetical protein [Phenylobacterium sp.]
MLALGAAVGTAAAGASIAQQMPAITVGQRVLEFGASAQAFYDSNVARGSDALARRRGLEKDDTTFRPSVSANIVQPLGQQAVFLTGSAGYDFHRKNTRLDRGRADVTGGATGRVGPCQPLITAGYRAGQSDLADADDLTVRNLQQSTSVQTGLTCGRPIGPGLQAMVGRQQVKNSAALRKTSDADTETASVSLTYTHPSLGQAGVIWNYSGTEFPNRIIPGRPVGDGFFTSSYGVSYSRNFGPRLTVDGLAQRTQVKREFAPPGTPRKFTSTTYGANAKYRFGQRIEVEAHALRQVKPSNRPEKLYDVVTSGEVLANYRLGSRYKINLGHRIEDLDSNADLSASARPVVTASRTNTTYGGVTYRQSDRLSFIFDVRHERRKTDLPDFNYSSNRIGITANVGF